MDPVKQWDEQRRTCPVKERTRVDRRQSDARSWDVLGHPETLAVLLDHETFSNEVSVHLSVPNGMDPPRHGPYRAIVERYFTQERMTAFEPTCRKIAVELVDALVEQGGGDAMEDLGTPFAVRIQCAFMGWPDAMRAPLAAWQDANHRAKRAGDKDAASAVAEAFEDRVSQVLHERRAMGAEAPDDPTTQLLQERIDGRRLTDAEIVSIIRNWTAGELGTIAASVGIVTYGLSRDAALTGLLRKRPERISGAIDEMLRARGPLVANRRVAARDTVLGGCPIHAGDRLRILWPAANRDERVFAESDAVRLERDPADNLLYGAGIHVCPGAPLARLELTVLTEELLARADDIAPDPTRDAALAEPPQGGFSSVPIRVR